MIIDGKLISQKILKELKEEILQKNLNLRLAAVLVSDNHGIKKFVELKGKAAREAGIDYNIFEFPVTISEEALKNEVRKIVSDESNNGVLVELPLPERINAQKVLNEIDADKDVDALSQEMQDRFFSNESGILPPAVEAVRTVMEFNKFDVKGKKAAVFGYGLLVGKPVAHWLSQNGADVSVIDKNTKNSEKYSLEADIIVSGVGKPEFIGGDMVKNGAVAIDFGYSNKGGRMTGDFKFDEVAAKAILITPVPGGIGPLVVVAVLKNLVKLNV